jgi:uncharacterized membrane protein YbhN (UPF0104 family)
MLFLFAVGYVLSKNVGDWATVLHSFDPRYLAIAFVAHSCALGFAAATWHRMLATLGQDTNAPRNVSIYVTTAFARRLPGSYWGPVLRMFWYRRLAGDWRTAGAASVLEVWAISVSGVVLAAGGIVLFIGVASERIWLSTVIALILLATSCVPPVNRWLLSRLLTAMRPKSANLAVTLPDFTELTRWIGLEAANWVFGGIELAAILRALMTYDSSRIPGIISAWTIAGSAGALITFLPGGFGVVELLLVGLLGLWFPTSVAILTALGMRLFTTACEFVWMVLGFSGATLFSLRRRQAF